MSFVLMALDESPFGTGSSCESMCLLYHAPPLLWHQAQGQCPSHLWDTPLLASPLLLPHPPRPLVPHLDPVMATPHPWPPYLLHLHHQTLRCQSSSHAHLPPMRPTTGHEESTSKTGTAKRIPRALRALMPHNAPSLKEQTPLVSPISPTPSVPPRPATRRSPP